MIEMEIRDISVEIDFTLVRKKKNVFLGSYTFRYDSSNQRTTNLRTNRENLSLEEEIKMKQWMLIFLPSLEKAVEAKIAEAKKTMPL